MSGIVKPCPWCHGTNLNWTVSPYSRHVVPECDDCQAKGPPMYYTGHDRDGRNATAINSWNAR